MIARRVQWTSLGIEVAGTMIAVAHVDDAHGQRWIALVARDSDGAIVEMDPTHLFDRELMEPRRLPIGR